MPRPPAARQRANGPYKQGNKWRAVLSPPPSDGTSRYRTFDTKAECQRYIDLHHEERDERTLGQAVTAYLEHLARYGGTKKRNRPLKATSVDRARHGLLAILQLRTGDRPLASLTASAAQKLYKARQQETKVDTHRGDLIYLVSACRWWVEQGWLSANPAADVKPEGERTEGKRTLKVDDARKFLATALEEGSPEGLACALLLVLGLRASELADRMVEDVNASPPMLVVPRGKTRAAKRTLAIPAPLGALVVAHAAKMSRGSLDPSSARLFNLSRYALHYHVKRLCKLAGVPEVCPHGLRGTCATVIASASGVEAAARLLGHENTTVTLRHYVDPGTAESASAEAKMAVLTGGNEMETVPAEKFPTTEPTAWN